MTLTDLVATASSKANFSSLQDYIDFCCRFLDFTAPPEGVGEPDNLQARIVCQNENNYRFYQYKADGHYNITRPINAALMYTAEDERRLRVGFLEAIRSAAEVGECKEADRETLRRSIYTVQQAIGAALDALPAGRSNTARKINGDLFERLIRLLIAGLGVECKSGVINVPVVVDYTPEFVMSYQHDLLVYQDGELKIIGSVKTSSKDRLDKIFIDKFLYSRLTATATPHIAVFLNDVQRKRTARENQYAVNTTFLPGHFRGYSVKLNPLDGVYYCDIRPLMQSDPFLSERIHTIDRLFCDDIAAFLKQPGLPIPASQQTRETLEEYTPLTTDGITSE